MSKKFLRGIFLPARFGSEEYLNFSFLHVITMIEMLRSFSFCIALATRPTLLPSFTVAVLYNLTLALGCNILNRVGYTNAASYIFIVFFQLQLYGFAWVERGILSPAMISSTIATFWAGFLLLKRFTIMLTATTIAVGYFYAYLMDKGLMPPPSYGHTSIGYWSIFAYNILSLMVSQMLIVTLLKRTMEREVMAKKDLQQANRVKDDFLANISHELRTPLVSISGWTDLLLHEELDEDTKKIALSTIERNALQQNKIIEDLVDLSRVDRGTFSLEWEVVDIIGSVREAVDTMTPTAKELGIEWRLELTNDDTKIWADRGRMHQILWNLLSNAVKFSERNSLVTIRVRRDGDFVAVTVEDQGVGISSAALQHIFEHFFQSDTSRARRFGGLGIGLSIVKNLVDLQGGTIEATSEGRGKGAQFTVRFKHVSAAKLKIDEMSPKSAASNDRPSDHDAAPRASS